MGKVTLNKKQTRHQPFHKDLEGDGSFKQKAVKQKHNKDGNEDEEAYLDSKTTSKILKMAIEQQEDMDEDKDEYDQLVLV
ncbi:hypothetical protein CONCODRAFT_159895 [Conidiobolus coronatus NRRL 28638]|uniref:Uncharacterized protein n=1 Tax=Conidiobolus coronatus (strain ATCC 28846 / CBS 209.66 / NRRL 28638) TaxID=796925 RepID=A0A137P6B5_CONC2|nr:hypothetical protein CONCODRAFT_159895 [Conidiobolus coronatus NRRL 28638]|eukprot:KXN70563.1 hypothetical protein CONCODRAFT_159895 [Conidiobolus coronatus NRRL 28638]